MLWIRQMLERKEHRARTAGILCVLFCSCILIAGLWPFGHPRNDLAWIPNHNAVRFGKHSTILSAGSLPAGPQGSCSVEMWLRPLRSQDSSSLLSFYGPSGIVGLSLHQSLTDLRLDSESGRARPAKMYVNDVFQAGKLVLVTVVAGPHGTAVYLDGTLARRTQGFQPSPQSCSGSFVVGDSPTEHSSWHGELGGLAIYGQELTAGQVALSYRSWTKNRRPAGNIGGEPKALYLFNEGRGSLIDDHGTSGVSLSIPERYLIVKQTLLESPLGAFETKWGYIEDISINIGGFIPFGFALGAFLSMKRRVNRVALLTVLVGFLVSIAIEALQSWLPTRNSDFTDVITNTLGTWVGVALNQRLLRWWT
jgi:hypothetical protein